MRQVSNSDFETLLRHLPRAVREGMRSGDNRTYNSARMLLLLHGRLERAEAKRKGNNEKTLRHGK